MIIIVPISFNILLRQAHALCWIIFQKNFNEFYARGRYFLWVLNMRALCNFVQNLIILVWFPGWSSCIELKANDAEGPEVSERTTYTIVTDHFWTQEISGPNKCALLLPSDRLLRYLGRHFFRLTEHVSEERGIITLSIWLVIWHIISAIQQNLLRKLNAILLSGISRLKKILSQVKLPKLAQCSLIKFLGLPKITYLYPIALIHQQIFRLYVSVTNELLMNGSNA